MDDQRKSRIIILAVGLALFGAGIFGFMYYTEHQQSETSDSDLATMEHAGKAASPMLASKGTDTAPGTTTDAATTPAATTPAATPPAATTPAATTPAATTPAATTPAATTPAATTPTATPPVATTPAATTPAVTTATMTPPVAPVVKLPPAKPLAIASAPINPPVQTPAATAPAATSSPIPAPVAAAPEPPANPNAIGVERLKKRFPAMKRDELVSAARQAAGRQDPMMPYLGGNPYPFYSKGTEIAAKDEENKETAKENVKVPPPPPIAKTPKLGAPPSGLVPPPPPSDPSLVAGAGGGGMGLPINELPQAPDKPTVADKLKLAAVIGNKVILNVPYNVRQQNKWPATISLGPGEQFESLSVVSVDGDSVTLDEDGERTVKTLASIK